MVYIDEVFARLEREKEQAMQKAEEMTNNTYDQMEELSEEEKETIAQGIKKGALNIAVFDMEFERRDFFENRFSMVFPKNYFEQMTNEGGYIVECNMRHTIHSIFSFAKGTNIQLTVTNLKKEMKENLAKRQIHTIWIEDGLKRIAQNKAAYCLFITKAQKDVFFQYMIFMEVRDGFLTWNLNGDIKWVKIWEEIIKNMLQTVTLE